MSPRKSSNSTPPPNKSKKIVAFNKPERKSESVVEYDDSLPTPLTLKEKNVLEFLELYIRENGISPTYSEICQHFGFASYNSVQRYLKQLETKGYIRTPGGNQKRALMLLRPASAVQETVEEFARDTSYSSDDSSSGNVRNVIPALHSNTEVFNLPMLGRVAAGAPIEAYEHDEYIDVPASLVRHADRTYALRVQGQSMIEDGIFDGDVILVQRQSQASNGEIVVAMIGEEATVKRFYTHNKDPRASDDRAEGGHSSDGFGKQKMIELRPANSNMSSLWFAPNEVQIRGVVVGLIRKF